MRFMMWVGSIGGICENHCAQAIQFLTSLPMQRYGTPREIADCAMFLASPLAAYFSGTIIPVDGGSCHPQNGCAITPFSHQYAKDRVRRRDQARDEKSRDD